MAAYSSTMELFSWNKDLLSNLDKLMSTSFHDDSSSDGEYFPAVGVPNFCIGFPSCDALDSIRRDSLEDFRHNGRECDLDELDSYQVELRRQSAKDRIFIEEENNPVVLEVLAFKERKRAASKAKLKKLCAFCKNNNETFSFFTSHVLKDEEGKVCCPVLRKYTCPLCGISGDGAHTIRYCPKNESEVVSSLTLKTKRVSSGKIRRLPSGPNDDY